jgi:hypothetical protein
LEVDLATIAKAAVARRKFVKPAVVRSFIENVIPHDQIFTILFIRKSDNQERLMNCRRGVNVGLVGTGRPKSDKTITVYDLQKQEYRSFGIEKVLEIKGAGVTLRAS